MRIKTQIDANKTRLPRAEWCGGPNADYHRLNADQRRQGEDYSLQLTARLRISRSNLSLDNQQEDRPPLPQSPKNAGEFFGD
jgi:hypothetical protein